MSRSQIAAVLALVTVIAVGSGRYSVVAQAPTPAPAYTLVSTVHVKPDMLDAYRALIKNEAIPAYKKAGLAFRWVFEPGPLGGEQFTVVSVQPFAKLAEFDAGSPIRRALGDEGMAKYNAKLRSMVTAQQNVFQRLVPEASLQGASSTPPALARVVNFRLMPGKGQEFAQLIAQDVLPAYKKAGIASYLVFATSYGAPGNERTVVEYLSKYADLDGPNPLIRAAGQEGFQKINQRRQALIQSQEATVLRLVPELSYGMPAPPKR